MSTVRRTISLPPVIADRIDAEAIERGVSFSQVIAELASREPALALSRPAAAASLNDWSPRPPTSYAIPTLMSEAIGAELVEELEEVPPAVLVDVVSVLVELPQAVRVSALADTAAATFIN